MDITLERILSLMPRKADGALAHGAKKTFAENIGLKSGNVIADWLSGKSKSYNGYVYEIANKYNVSVEWLKGESDIKEKAAPLAGSDLNSKYYDLTPENRALIDGMIEQMLKAQSAD